MPQEAAAVPSLTSQCLPYFIAGRRASLGSCCYSPSSLGTCSSYQDLAKHIVDISMADVRSASLLPMVPLIDLGCGEEKGRKEQGRGPARLMWASLVALHLQKWTLVNAGLSD